MAEKLDNMKTENNDLRTERDEFERDLSSSKEMIDTITTLFMKMKGKDEEEEKELMGRLWKGTLEL
jgi:septal ring factor EnvC (AmiA/AmiB activator)